MQRKVPVRNFRKFHSSQGCPRLWKFRKMLVYSSREIFGIFHRMESARY